MQQNRKRKLVQRSLTLNSTNIQETNSTLFVTASPPRTHMHGSYAGKATLTDTIGFMRNDIKKPECVEDDKHDDTKKLKKR